MMAGAVGRFPAIEVKLNGVTAKTKPSSGRASLMFHMPGDDSGCWPRIVFMKYTLKRKKSMSSQAESISAWNAVFDWPSIVAALSVARYSPARRSAAFRNTAARASHGSADQSFFAAMAALIAASTSRLPALWYMPSTCL